MIKKILVPTDFSKQARYAFEVACQIGRYYNAKIHLLHLVELPYSMMQALENGKGATLPESLFFLKLAQKNFKELKEDYKSLIQDLKIKESVKFNSIQKGVEAYIKKRDISLVIMGSHGASGLGELFIGSNTEKIVRNVKVPVLVIKKKHPQFKIKTFVFATDLEEDNKAPLLQALEFTKPLKIKLKLVYVNTPEQFKTSEEIKLLYKNFITKAGVKPEHFEIYNDVTVERGILNYANELQADLVGIGTHGRKGLAHFFNGSLSEDLVNHAKRPVLTFKI